jgi:hypothetical protein
MAKSSGWSVGSPPEICSTSGSPSLRTSAVEHVFDGRQITVAGTVRTAVGVADRQRRLQWSVISIRPRQECCM